MALTGSFGIGGRMRRNTLIAAIPVAIVLVAAYLAVPRVGDEASDSPPTIPSATESAVDSGGETRRTDADSDDAAKDSDTGGSTSKSNAGQSDGQSAETFEELPIDPVQVDLELVERAVCDLGGTWFSASLSEVTPSAADLDGFRDIIVVTEERLADYSLAEDLDPTISESLDIAWQIVEHWNGAVAAGDAGDEKVAQRELDESRQLTEQLEAIDIERLCPSA